MRIFSELIKARLENVAGAITSAAKGLIYFRTDTNRPHVDDGTTVDQLMMEKHLPEARRNTKIQLDDTGTGNEVEGVLPPVKGGTGLNDLSGQSGKFVKVNTGETALEFADAAQSLGDLTDVDLTTPATEGQALLYNSVSTNFEPADIAVGVGVEKTLSATLDANGVVGDLSENGVFEIGKEYKLTVSVACSRSGTDANEIQDITFSAVPNEGNFTITFDGQTTSTLWYDAVAADVQAALEALSNVGVGNVTVTGDFTSGFTIEFIGALANTNQPQVTLATNTLKSGGTGGQNEIQRITFSQTPTAGTFTITFDGQTTAAIPYNASAAQVKAALEALPNIDEVNVTDI